MSLRQQPVRADDEVDGPVGEAREGRLLLLRGTNRRQQPDLDREGREPLAERRVVLGASTVVGHQHRHLRAVLDRLERGPQGDLGLAVAHVADDQAVHRPGLLHVGLDLGGGAQLVGRLLVRERRPPSPAARACPARTRGRGPRRAPRTARAAPRRGRRPPCATRCLVRSHSRAAEPGQRRAARRPRSGVTRSICSTGTKMRSPPAKCSSRKSRSSPAPPRRSICA